MHAFERIVVPTDFSEQSDAAVVEAVHWARWSGAKLDVVHVTTTSYWPTLEEADPEFEILEEALHEDSLARLRAVRTRRIRSDIKSEVHSLSGTPHAAIAEFARDHRADLLIVATRGHSKLERFFLGSTTERIVRSARCSVLVLRAAARPVPDRSPGLAGLRVVLVATDFSESSVRALERAVAIAAPANAELVLLHVLRDADHPMREALPRTVWSAVRRRSQTWLDKLQADRVAATVPSRVMMIDGVPSARIADVADEVGADLIVLGSTGRSGGHSLLGSTAERVVRVAPCSVLVERADLVATERGST